MRKFYRILILTLLILSAVLCGVLGSTNGLGVFLVLAILFESAFWIGLFKIMKRPAQD